jgi:hypothetical protein
MEAQRIEYLMQLPEEKPYFGAWAPYTNSEHFIRLLPPRKVDPRSKRLSIFRQLDRIRLITEVIQAKTAHGMLALVYGCGA